MSKFLMEVVTWYWWLSVVLVGLLINLASAYLKPRIDAILAVRSQRARSGRAQRDAAFEQEVERLASDGTRLILAGQRLQSMSMAKLDASSFLILVLIFAGFLDASSSSNQTLIAVLKTINAVVLTVSVVVVFAFMKREALLEAKVAAARRRYEQEFN